MWTSPPVLAWARTRFLRPRRGRHGRGLRARDTKLGRESRSNPARRVRGDPERVARFQREAQSARVAKPSEHRRHLRPGRSRRHQGPRDGTGRGRRSDAAIARGAIPLDEALPIAKQIAEALEAAHEQGSSTAISSPPTSRCARRHGEGPGLRPREGDWKPRRASPSVSQSPTITTPAMTQAGRDPRHRRLYGAGAGEGEAGGQAQRRLGVRLRALRNADRRARLRRRRRQRHAGAVLRGEPDWRTLPPETPASIRRLLRRCLEKDRKRRLSDAAGARLEIDDALTVPASDVVTLPATASRAGWLRGAVIATAALVVGGAAAGGAVWITTRPGPARVMRTTIQTSGATALVNSPRAAGSRHHPGRLTDRVHRGRSTRGTSPGSIRGDAAHQSGLTHATVHLPRRSVGGILRRNGSQESGDDRRTAGDSVRGQ